jgi:hypothetical protein
MKAESVRSLEPRGPLFDGAPQNDAREPNTSPPARLGRGIVTSVAGAGVTVALADGRQVTAELALALPYAACEGDVLLVIGDDREFFVIGVLAGRGKTSLELPGDVSLRAVGGTLELSGDAGVRVTGPTVEVRADRLVSVARSVVETFSSLFQRVTEVLHVHAREEVTIVDEGSFKQAKTAAIQTEETITINGREIHLG